MKIDQLQIENFMAIGSTELSLNERGLLLIQGENWDDLSQDSNGSGKSTIADAISWCLYGKTARGESGDKIVNTKNKKNARVSLMIETEDGQQYEISRYRKHSEYKNSARLKNLTAEIDLTQGTDRLTQESIDKIIGCSYEVFSSAVYFGQENQADLPGMTDKQLKTIVEESSGINRLQSAHESARESVKDLKHKIKELDWKLSTFQDAKGMLEEEFEIVSGKALNFESSRKMRYAKAMSDYKIAQRNCESANALFNEAQGAIYRAQKELDEGEEEFRAIDPYKYERVIKEKEDSDNAVKLIKVKLTSMKEVIDELKKERANIDSKIDQPCTECGKPISEHDLSAVIEAKDNEISAKVDQFNAFVEEEVNPIKERAIKLRDRAAKSESKLEQIKTLEEHRASLQRIVERGCEVEEKTFENSRIINNNAVEECNRIRDEKNHYAEQEEDLQKKIADHDVQIDDLESQLKKLQDKLKMMADVEYIFSTKGVRSHILDTVTPFLNERTGHYLSHLSDGNLEATWNTIGFTAKGELRDSFHIDVKSKTGGSHFGLLSGGEKRKVRLATSLALQDLVAQRATQNIKLWIGDEIDHALDESGMERLMHVLEEKARDKGTVLVISHNELGDWIRNTLTVIKKDGLARVA